MSDGQNTDDGSLAVNSTCMWGNEDIQIWFGIRSKHPVPPETFEHLSEPAGALQEIAEWLMEVEAGDGAPEPGAPALRLVP